MAEPGFNVFLMAQAEDDLESIRNYLIENASPQDATRLLNKLDGCIESLETYPLRGNVPKELEEEGVLDSRQLTVPPYRLVYRVLENSVFVILVADGRRDMKALLRRRLLGG
ncbi:type II toxin-antitoxin system RelE/ParE family toxin [Sphingomonas sp. M1-B02]|uniref:type II toxin-antitoxin system RelE/ParE family toxin n=1 Tax=Sphingomonas sp. M1-B02 TaxID=3114300 RepID=UPI00223FAB70|nr:type II toxin-antitoxin system RelE/ParE family toxin [Sphingomonas sp. S6-11]UZK66877.1 type II toxin-antitoxin system RelE/ParE family toxin [Sphingomonas sp. S6-11]